MAQHVAVVGHRGPSVWARFAWPESDDAQAWVVDVVGLEHLLDVQVAITSRVRVTKATWFVTI